MTSSHLHDVFLSYSRKDTEMMHRVRNALIVEGITVWTDEGIEPGTDLWQEAIGKAIENAGVFIVLLSPDARESKWVGREISYAQTQNLKTFGLLVRGDEKTSIPFGLAGSQHIDARTDFRVVREKLLPVLRKFLSKEVTTESKEKSQPIQIVETTKAQLPDPEPGRLIYWHPAYWFKLVYWLFFKPEIYNAQPKDHNLKVTELLVVSLAILMPLFY